MKLTGLSGTLGVLAFLGVIGTATVYDGFFITQEGYSTVVKTMGKAEKEVGPGFHFKIPFTDSIEHTDMRVRKAGGEMKVATSEQMPVLAIITANWYVKPLHAKALYSTYGKLEDFEKIVLNSKIFEAAKQGSGSFTAEQLITKRMEVSDAILKALRQKVSTLPIVIDSIQIDDFNLPDDYEKAIANKQTQKTNADAEQFVLEKQNLTARQKENTAQADANSILMINKAQAESIQLKGLAEAKAIEAKGSALSGNPLIIELTKAQNWNGSYATTIIGSDVKPILDVRQK